MKILILASILAMMACKTSSDIDSSETANIGLLKKDSSSPREKGEYLTVMLEDNSFRGCYEREFSTFKEMENAKKSDRGEQALKLLGCFEKAASNYREPSSWDKKVREFIYTLPRNSSQGRKEINYFDIRASNFLHLLGEDLIREFDPTSVLNPELRFANDKLRYTSSQRDVSSLFSIFSAGFSNGDQRDRPVYAIPIWRGVYYACVAETEKEFKKRGKRLPANVEPFDPKILPSGSFDWSGGVGDYRLTDLNKRIGNPIRSDKKGGSIASARMPNLNITMVFYTSANASKHPNAKPEYGNVQALDVMMSPYEFLLMLKNEYNFTPDTIGTNMGINNTINYRVMGTSMGSACSKSKFAGFLNKDDEYKNAFSTGNQNYSHGMWGDLPSLYQKYGLEGFKNWVPKVR